MICLTPMEEKEVIESSEIKSSEQDNNNSSKEYENDMNISLIACVAIMVIIIVVFACILGLNAEELTNNIGW